MARLAAENIDSHYSLILTETLKKEAFEENFEERMRSLTAVHYVLAEICGNSFYEIMVNSLISISHEIILNTFEEGDAPLHGLGQHDQIVQAVLEKETEKAAQAMRDHLKKFAEALVELDMKYRQK